MPTGLFILPRHPVSDPEAPEVDPLTYVVGRKTVTEEYVTRFGPKDKLPKGVKDPKAIYDYTDPENPVLTGWDVYRWREVEVDDIAGGYVLIAQDDNDRLVWMKSSDAQLASENTRLKAIDEFYGHWGDEYTPDDDRGAAIPEPQPEPLPIGRVGRAVVVAQEIPALQKSKLIIRLRARRDDVALTDVDKARRYDDLIAAVNKDKATFTGVRQQVAALFNILPEQIEKVGIG